MSWKPAPAATAALSEATRRWPNRKKNLDGTIGNALHAVKVSDHNPDSRGIVHAFDITHDPANGVDCEKLAAHLVKWRDSRVKQIIWNRRTVHPPDWSWRPYTGDKPHTTHMHVSVLYTTAAENDTSSWWNLDAGVLTKGDYLQNELLSAMNSGNWLRAFNLLNSFSMTHMLEALDSVNVEELIHRRAAYGGAVNMPRLEYAMHVVQHRQLPAVAPGDLQQTKQVEEARAFLNRLKPSGTSAFPARVNVSPYGGAPLAHGQRRPLPTGYGPVRQPNAQEVAKANELLKRGQPIGTHFEVTLGGQQYIFAVEWHKHPPTDPVRESLKKWHPGISVYRKQ